MQITAYYGYSGNPAAVYETSYFTMISSSLWYTGIKIAGFILYFNLLLVYLAIFSNKVRRIVFHPVGSYVLGLIVGKYLLVDFFIRFVSHIRIGLLQDYRKGLWNSPIVKLWRNRQYIPPQITIKESIQEFTSENGEWWKKVLEKILGESTGQLWLLVGKSGLGKTALLEKWTEHALSLNKTPFFIPLGSTRSPQIEATALMAQYGDIDVKEDVTVDLLTFGGFLVLLDGFNEDRHKEATQEFVRRVILQNHVVLTSQFDPQWENIINVQHINLHPFGKEQLEQIIEEKFVESLLNSPYLSDLAELPHTAQLLAQYIHQNKKLPDFRLDIYRNLLKKFGDGLLVLNLEHTAWDLFKTNSQQFEPNNKIPREICDSAVAQGILTKADEKYRFRHAQIHCFFVANYLYRQELHVLEEWHKQIEGGRERYDWADILELWAEIFAEKAIKDPKTTEDYFSFLKQVAEFHRPISHERLLPQIRRLNKSGKLQIDEKFYVWVGKSLWGLSS